MLRPDDRLERREVRAHRDEHAQHGRDGERERNVQQQGGDAEPHLNHGETGERAGETPRPALDPIDHGTAGEAEDRG